MLWDLQPSENPQARTPRSNVISVRVGCLASFAKYATAPIKACNLFITDQMLNDITVYTNIYTNKNKFSREGDAKTTLIEI